MADISAQSLARVSELQSEIDEAASSLYGFQSSIGAHEDSASIQADDEADDFVQLDVAKSLFSFLIGVAFGRWAILHNPEVYRGVSADPFAELPVLAPARAPADAANLYYVEEDAVESPLMSAFRLSLCQATGLPNVDNYEQDLSGRLGASSLREYLIRPAGFFADHLAVYSKSRRKAPIYWPLSTRSGEFILWVYYPKFDADSLPRLITEVLDPRLRSLNEEISSLVAEGRTAGRRAKLEALRLELAEMRQDFQELIAKGYKPDLNDGVLITACPLAKYFRHAGFRKNLEACWKELARGDYDWAHLAMSMWPERATKACRSDRSIAIAHGREDLCPAEPPKATRGRKKESA